MTVQVGLGCSGQLARQYVMLAEPPERGAGGAGRGGPRPRPARGPGAAGARHLAHAGFGGGSTGRTQGGSARRCIGAGAPAARRQPVRRRRRGQTAPGTEDKYGCGQWAPAAEAGAHRRRDRRGAAAAPEQCARRAPGRPARQRERKRQCARRVRGAQHHAGAAGRAGAVGARRGFGAAGDARSRAALWGGKPRGHAAPGTGQR